MRETRKEQQMIYDEKCVVCGGTFKVDTDTHLKGTKTCSAKCFRELKHRREAARWQKRYGKEHNMVSE
jgi:hypothetical protein